MSEVDFSDPAVIAELSAALQAAGVDGIEIVQPARTVRIVVDRGIPSSAIDVGVAALNRRKVEAEIAKAPLAGYFEPSDSAALPRHVTPGDVLGMIRIGPVLLPVTAAVGGRLIACLAEPGAVVGYGDPLFEIEPRP